jgi:hypothetical protein
MPRKGFKIVRNETYVYELGRGRRERGEEEGEEGVRV